MHLSDCCAVRLLSVTGHGRTDTASEEDKTETQLAHWYISYYSHIHLYSSADSRWIQGDRIVSICTVYPVSNVDSLLYSFSTALENSVNGCWTDAPV